MKLSPWSVVGFAFDATHTLRVVFFEFVIAPLARLGDAHLFDFKGDNDD